MFISFHFFFFKHKTAYDLRISDWSSDVCSSDLIPTKAAARKPERAAVERDEIFVHHVIVQREEGLAVIDLGGSRGIEIGVGSELAADEADHPVGKRTERRCRIVEALLDRKSTRLNSSP